MKKIINRPEQFVSEFLEGILLAHPRAYKRVGGAGHGLIRADAPSPGRVGIVTGGGSGHLPLFLGYVGMGLCSGVAIGNVFSSPSAESVLEVTRAVNGGAGVLYLYGNYGGDVMNFDEAAEMAAEEGIEVETVLMTDDVASAPRERASDRRGIAGMVFAFKCAGAAAEQGASLAQVTEVARSVTSVTATMGVGLAPTILPEAGRPTFVLGDGEMEIGIGIHGEPGTARGQLLPADQIAAELLGAVLEDLKIKEGEEVALMVNGLGATPLEELYVLCRKAHTIMGGRSIGIGRSFVGELATSLEMAGASISVMALDAELSRLLDAPAFSPFFSVCGSEAVLA
ncbi:MAG: dihydroxyacetone kinase subunit DhaK [Actinomycetota bacterium]|nr:dihydroxyacetone kinase subunit DhaK [Actinomycetota bacterium]